MVYGRGPVKAVLNRLGGECARVIFFCLRNLFAAQGCLNGRQHFIQRLRMSGLTPLYLNNVIAELRLHDLRFADLLGKDGIVKLRHHAPALRGAEFPTRILAAWIVGIFLREFSEASATLDLFENI